MRRKPKPESLARMQNQTPMASYLERLCKERRISLQATNLAAGLGEATLGKLMQFFSKPLERQVFEGLAEI